MLFPIFLKSNRKMPLRFTSINKKLIINNLLTFITAVSMHFIEVYQNIYQLFLSFVTKKSRLL